MKNKFLMLMVVGLIFPFGGIGFSGISNIYDTGTLTETVDDIVLTSTSDGLESGLNFFIYFDAIPNGWAVEYSRELRVQLINTTLDYMETGEIKGEMASYRTSDYLTAKKEMLGLSIPFLAKASIYLGGGINQHNSTIPSIDLLTDITGAIDFENLYAGFDFETIGLGDIMDKIDKHSTKAQGLHIQASLQAKLLMLNTFINARYTFIMDNDKMESFPGLTIGFAYGI
jgi:hypothetical protein